MPSSANQRKFLDDKYIANGLPKHYNVQDANITITVFLHTDMFNSRLMSNRILWTKELTPLGVKQQQQQQQQ